MILKLQNILIMEKECKDCLDKRSDSCWICPYYPILDLITKVRKNEKEPKEQTNE